MVSWFPDTELGIFLAVEVGGSWGPGVRGAEVTFGVKGGPLLLGPPGVRGIPSDIGPPGVYGGPSPLLELVDDLRRSLLHHFQSGWAR